MDPESADRKSLVLLVEDNRADVLLIERAIDEHSVPVQLLVLEDGEQAIEYLASLEADSAKEIPDLILLDLNLPRWSGTDVLQRLRAGSRCRNIPVIVLTSSDSPDRAITTNLGISEYFRKPISYREFMKIGEIVKRVLREAPAA